MRRIVVFFSWQSDTLGNHSAIKSGLEKACKKLSKELDCEVAYDESLRGELGSPQIESVVARKIHDCDIFLADLTPVVGVNDKRLPNSNVMYELGRAEESHSSEQIVKIANKDDFDVKKLPFDINHSSIISVDITDKDSFYNLIKHEVRNVFDFPQTIFSKNDETLYSDFQIQKNIKSGKYLRDTFLEKRDLKEHLRYFVDPYLFSRYVVDRTYRLSFDRLNRGRKIWNKPKFNFNVTQFIVDDSVSSFSHLYEPLLKMREYIKEKGTNLSSQSSNEDYFSSTKCGRKVADLTYLTSKLCLLTGKAGQGKTNFLCDFTENVLLKRHIPFVYVNGYEVDATDLEKSFTKAICPALDISFSKMMNELAKYCSAKRKPIVFIIDGLNENPHPVQFADSLVSFIKRFLSFDFVKMIMTCRSDYLDENFSELKEVFYAELIIVRDIYMHINNEDEQLLLNKYFRYFNVEVQLDEGVISVLTNNLLLLRIFCEANKNKSLGFVGHIKRDELFTAYYDEMLSRVVDAHDWEGRKSLRPRKITNFFYLILKYMIENDTFFNVPLKDLFSELNEEDENMLLRFLDENILLRKDLSERKGSLASNEVVNFTYDAFRDYLLAHYILDTLLGNLEEQKTLINEYTGDGHQLKEGIIPYLFVHAKNEERRDILDFMKLQPWYASAFKAYVWDVDESKLTADDIELLKTFILENPRELAKRLLYRGRWNTDIHPILNIRILLDIVSQMEDTELNDWIEQVWPSTTLEIFCGRKQYSKREKFVSINEELLDDEQFLANKGAKLIFEFFAYVASVSDVKAKNVYLRYIKQTQNWEQVMYLSSHAESENVKKWMSQIISEK